MKIYLAMLGIVVVLLNACSGNIESNVPPETKRERKLISIAQLKTDYANGNRVVVGIIGNSKACGYREAGWELLVAGGDNITAEGLLTQTGEDNHLINGWGQNLKRWLQQKNADSQVYNFAGSGWTTQTHIDKGTVAALAAMVPKPTAVFIPLQVNDRLKDSVTVSVNKGGITWDMYLANTRSLVRALLAEGILPVLVKEDNSPLAGGAGWYWSEYDTGMAHETKGIFGGTNDDTHRPFSDYVNALDTIAKDAEWINSGVGALTVIDTYTPTLNMGQESQYRYVNPTTGDVDNSMTGLAPADFRYSLMHGWIAGTMTNDVWHQSDAGGEIILKQYKHFFDPTI